SPPYSDAHRRRWPTGWRRRRASNRGATKMLFDLKGKRRRTVQVTYVGLAFLMAAGLIGAGIGCGTSGGIFDLFGDGRGDSTASTVSPTPSATPRTYPRTQTLPPPTSGGPPARPARGRRARRPWPASGRYSWPTRLRRRRPSRK